MQCLIATCCTDIESCKGKKFRIWLKSRARATTLTTTHHWCLTSSWRVCCLSRVVRPWQWTQQAYCNNHWGIQCLIARWCTDIESCKGENFRIRLKSASYIFGDTSLMSDMFLVCMLLVKGCQTLVMDPTSLLQQSLVNTVPHCKMLHWYWVLQGREILGSDKNLATSYWWHIIDVWHVPSVYVACKGLSDLSNGPNKPTATIIGEFSASLQDAALILSVL